MNSLQGFGIAVVLRSEHPDVKAGDHVSGIICTFRIIWVSSFSTNKIDALQYSALALLHQGRLDDDGDYQEPKQPSMVDVHRCSRHAWWVVLVDRSISMELHKSLGKTAYMAWKEYSHAKKVSLLNSLLRTRRDRSICL